MSRTVEVLDGAFRVRYGGVDRVIVLRSDVTVPFAEIDSVEVGLRDAPSPWVARRVGLADPITGSRRGRFWKDGRKYFLDLRDPRRALVLRLRPGSRFDVVAIETDDAEPLAEQLRERLAP